MKRIALVAREVYPFSGGGIAPIVTATAGLLTRVAEVTLVTSGAHRERYEELVAAADPTLPEGVHFVFVDEPGPEGYAPWFSHMHAYSGSVFEALCEAYPDGGPDLVEFCDYLGEGFVTVQARRTFDPRIRNSLVCVRLHTTAELCNVLDGHVGDDFATVATFDAERYVLRHADRILWSGGDVLGTYQRYYGAANLAPAVELPDAFLGRDDATPPPPGDHGSDEGPLRLLYLGRMERRKGVQNLLRAILSVESPHSWRLTLLGGDTATAPLQQSLRAQLELMAAGDERIDFATPVERHEVGDFIRRHDVVVAPSLWECWPNVVRESLMFNRPVLATPVGGLVEMVRPGVSGWLAEGTSPEALAAALERLLADRGAARRLAEDGGPWRVFEELTCPDRLVESYGRLLEARSDRAVVPGGSTPLVSIVVPYFRLDALVEDTLDSIAAQTYPNIETIVVNDGSLRLKDAILTKLEQRPGVRVVTQVNQGLSQARNFGVSQARGRYVLPLDADDLIHPTLVERCAAIMEADPSLAYVTPWSRFMSHEGELLSQKGGYYPYGNWSRLIERNNVAGTCTAMMRRRLFEDYAYSPDLTSYEDWFLYRRLHEAGRYGAVIPERLFYYRVRADSMMREVALPRVGLLFDEMRALSIEARTRWTAA